MHSPLYLFNTLSHKKELFTPSSKGAVKLYTCGPTVYNYAHIGNLRTYVFEDLFKRLLTYLGYSVKHIMNITDVDDKTIKGAIEKSLSLDQYTHIYTEAFFEDLKSLNILPADHYPKATDHIPEMITMIQDLLEKNIAYPGADGSIYFSIHKFKEYGKLSHLQLNELQEGASDRLEQDEYEKENATDFVLWKSYNKERDGNIFWDSPFGKGRPGWHIECSAMAIKHLGETLDIHMGGVDNIFPHHENEIAQSECFTCKTFCPFWVHVEHLVVDGKKMSKSLGNFFTLRDLLERGFEGKHVRYLLLQTHYKTQLNFTFDGLNGAKVVIGRIQNFIERLHETQPLTGNDTQLEQLIVATEEKFNQALCDDVNISVALAALFDFIRLVNSILDEQQLSQKMAEKTLEMLKKFDQILGIMSFQSAALEIPQALIEALEQRLLARKEKNWAEADRLRDLILSSGYLIEDTPQGPKLKKK